MGEAVGREPFMDESWHSGRILLRIAPLGNRCSSPAGKKTERSRLARPQKFTDYPRVFVIGTQAVDVVVAVYDALDYVRLCLESLRRHDDGFELRVIVVDDGSGPATARWLKDLAESWPALLVIEHERNLGYTFAVNSGLRATTADWVVILNSDTRVSKGWLAGMVRCAEADSQVGMVGPLSNAATWQSVPEVFDSDGRFAVNALPLDLDVDGMAELVRSASTQRYPRVPVLNGFCLLLRRDLLERVGFMDEVAFGVGYGEENDYCIRARSAGFELAVADDVFVFHAKSKSFGHALRTELSRRGQMALEAKHGEGRARSLGREIEASGGLRAARDAVQTALVVRRERARIADPLALRILFLLPVLGASGGANSVVLEAAEMARLGVTVRVAVPPRALGDLGAFYGEVPDVQRLLVAAELERLVELSSDFDVVVATAAHTVEWVAQIVAARPHVLPAYYVQDYEPWFASAGSAEARAAAASYERVPGALLFAKTRFLARTVLQLHGIDVKVVEPSLDHGTYYPADRGPRARVRVTAMVRPQTPRRAAPRTMRVLRDLARRHREQVEIHVFGCESNDDRFRSLERDFAFINHGVLRRPEVAQLLRDSDVFVDLSDYQAFGRTALEAMASGCVPAVPIAGGGAEFAVDGHNAVLVDTNREQACVESIAGLIAAPERLSQLRRAGLATAARFSLVGAARSELRVMAMAAAAWRAARPHPGHPKRLALASLGPNSRGRLAIGSALGGWKLPSVQQRWSVIQRGRLPKPGTADVAVVLVRPGACNWAELASWLQAWRKSRGRVVAHVDLSRVSAKGGQSQLPFDTRTLRAVRWLSGAADAVTVSSVAIAQALTSQGLEVAAVERALDPIIWRFGPAARRSGASRKVEGQVRVGVLGDVAHPELIVAVERLKQSHGERIVVETFSRDAALARLGKRLRLPTFRAESELAEWAFDHLTWDLALISAAEPEAWLECAALGVATVQVGRDAAEATRLASALIENELERARLAGEALAALENSRNRANVEGSVARLLDELMATPAKGEIPDLPLSLRGLTGTFFNRWQKDFSGSDGAPLPFPEARSRARRKLDKLRRDPARFLRDSGVKRSLDTLARRLRRSR
jgi:GT2 family glycosyltransferase/glycosyltransferase involved in cell wall biosynthesis